MLSQEILKQSSKHCSLQQHEIKPLLFVERTQFLLHMKWHAFNSKHLHRKYKSFWLNPHIKDFYSCLHISILLATKQLQMERCRICTARLAGSGLVVGGRSERQPFSEPHSIERQVSRALTLPAQPRLKNHHHHHHQNHANHHCYHHLGSLGYFVVVLEF